MSARRALEGIVAGLSATALVVLFAIGNISVGTLITGVLADRYPAFSPYGGYAFKLAMSFTFVIPIAGILAVLALLRPRFIVEALVGRPLPTSFFYYIAAGVALPFSFLVLGTEAETLGKLAYPNETLYRQLMSMIKPSGHPLDLIGAILSIGIIGPICEETLFRGLMIRALRSWPVGAAVAMQAFFFAALHGNVWQFSYALPVGIVLGAVRIWSGGLLAPMIVHVSNNVISLITMYWLPDIPFLNQDDFAHLAHTPLYLILPAAALLASAMIYMFQKRERTAA